MSGRLTVVVGGMYGSESKGRVSAYLTRPEEQVGPVYAVRVGGSNAGHTVFGTCPPACNDNPAHAMAVGPDTHSTGLHPWRLRHVPVAAVTNPEATLVLAAGSEIDPNVLDEETIELELAGYKIRDRLVVDATATVIESRHQEVESGLRTGSLGHSGDLVSRIGSTGKGVGAARADRAMRKATLWGQSVDAFGEVMPDTAEYLRHQLDRHDAHVLIEGVQGFGLGQHAGHYPHVTSSDCRAVDFLSMAGLSPWDPAVARFDTWVVVRTRPIRVAGTSGPLQGETTWADLNLPTEYTTVTRKERRVGEWDGELVKRAIRANGGRSARLAITMLDQLFPGAAGITVYGRLPAEAWKWLYALEAELGTFPELIGTGPHTLIDLR